MAKRVIEVLIDDLDGSESDKIESINFSIDSTEYQIDLSPKNADKLRGALMDYIAVARKVGGKTKRTAAKSSGEDLAAVRAWAKENGFEVSERGRVAQTVKDAYAAAH